jgi:hypothetical protein
MAARGRKHPEKGGNSGSGFPWRVGNASALLVSTLPVDNLVAKKNAFITPWEGDFLKEFFTHVRNPFGHGAGSAAMPTLSIPQTQ